MIFFTIDTALVQAPVRIQVYGLGHGHGQIIVISVGHGLVRN